MRVFVVQTFLTPYGVMQAPCVREEDPSVFGGAETAQRLVTAGLIDQFWLKVNTVGTGGDGAVFANG
jgi:hypothetical protein